jgi:DNA-directed RNA polymerase specialized sigma24 family protein
MKDSADWDLLRRSALAGARAGGDCQDAEDTAQESLLSFLVSAGFISDPPAFVFRKAQWIAIDRARCGAARQRREAEWARRMPQFSNAEDRTFAIDLARTLSADLLQIVMLLDEGSSFSEIGHTMELSKPAVQRRVEALRGIVAA